MGKSKAKRRAAAEAAAEEGDGGDALDLDRDELQQVLSGPGIELGYDGAKLTLALLAGSTKQMIRRLGWFRHAKLQTAADHYLQRSDLYKKAQLCLQEGEGEKMTKP